MGKHRARNIFRVTWIVFQVLLVLGLMSVLFAGGVGAGFFASQVNDEPIRSYEEIYNELHQYNQTGEAYFRGNESIGQLRTTEVSEPIKIDDVSPHMIDAILATEDSEFYEHQGVNVRGLSRAALEQVLTPGEGTGGSTVTQQLVKNQLLGPERQFERKFREILLAMRVERMFEKEEILESYMNIVYFGYNANGTNIEGIQAAAKGIFGVDAHELNIAQSAYLAGMIHSPGRYTPFNRNGEINEERLQRGMKRQNYVLGRMLETQRITSAQFNEAQSFNLKESLAKPTPGIVEQYPYLTFEIEEEAIEILYEKQIQEQRVDPESLTDEEKSEYREQARRELSRGGYQVHTTIDKELYEAFHELVTDDDLFGPESPNQTYTYTDPETGEEEERRYPEQTAATLIDIETGAILAMLEGRDWEESQINFSRKAPRQPGSSIKPLLDYGPAMEEGLLQPASVIDDVPDFTYHTDGRPATNFNSSRYYGLGTVREALTRSHNASAFKAFSKSRDTLGADTLYDYLQKLGLDHIGDHEIENNAISLGGLAHGLTVEQNTAAFATFANKGMYNQPYFIERIETLDGEIVYEHDQDPVQVFSEQTAFLMTDVLRSVVNDNLGTGRNIRNGLGSTALDIAGKTGTTNQLFDYWFVGYTPQLSLGVWLGYEKNDPLAPDYSPRNQNIWVQLMKIVEEVRPEYVNTDISFEMPDDIVEQTVCSKSGLLPSDVCRQEGYLVTDFFNRKYLPTETDDRVDKARIVIVDNQKYIAHDSTPDDFVEEGTFITRDPLQIPEHLQHNRSNYLPDDWDEGAPTEKDPRNDNGRTPSTPSEATIDEQGNGLHISWQRVEDNDIAGYRLYRARPGGQLQHIASIPDHENMTYTDEGVEDRYAYFYVLTAVDIAGRESDPSSIQDQQQALEEYEQEEREREEEELEQEREEEEEQEQEEEPEEEREREREDEDQEEDDENENDRDDNGNGNNEENEREEEDVNSNENENNDRARGRD